VPEPQVTTERLDDSIAVTVRLDPELVRSMTAMDQMNLGSLIHTAARKLLAQPKATDD
jgi:hypothetical protein